MKAEAPQITHRVRLRFFAFKKTMNGDEEYDDLLVLFTTLANAVFAHDSRHRSALYGMLLEISWLLRLLQYQFFACGVKTECELSVEG
ncbi:hypothetical protein [Microaerobacter geothermalis]|uniref:hypothetical protein n=1 Tax=Microaerobacter geothermalis TaxID=674972 RepID=UPI001F290EE7|nr:hypothetical protein [Microaerobacter geothermalis]